MNGQISALRAFCAWLTEERYLEVNPAKRLKLVGRQDASSREGLDDTQANALLRQAHNSRDPLRNYAIIQILLQTGMRLDECSQLTLDDIALGERSGRVTIRQGKGNKARIIPLNASVRQALAEYMAPLLNCDPTVKAVVRSWPARSSGIPSLPLWQSQKKGTLTTSAMRQMKVRRPHCRCASVRSVRGLGLETSCVTGMTGGASRARKRAACSCL